MKEKLKKRFFMLWTLELLIGIVIFMGLTALFSRFAKSGWYSTAATGRES